jgi:coatomer subunit beta'
MINLILEFNIDSKWKTLGDTALAAWNLSVAEKAFKKAKDFGSLLLLYVSSGSRQGLEELASLAQHAGQHNIAFTCLLTLNNIPGCTNILLSTGRYAESTLFSKTYQPSLVNELQLVEQWKVDLNKNKKEKIAKSIASPQENSDYFPGWKELLEEDRQDNSNGEIVDGIMEEKGRGHDS